MMPKKYVMKAETGYLSSKFSGEQPDETFEVLPTGMAEIGVLLVKLLSALIASNRLLKAIALHADSNGHVDLTINREALDELIKANEDALGMIVIKE